MSEADFQPLIEWLQSNPDWVLFSVFIIAFIESLALAGIIVPGVLLLFLVSAVAGNMGLEITAVLAAGFFGAILGDGISFYLGRYFKDSLHQTWPFSRYPKLLSSGERFFNDHGGKSVMIGRFIGPIRPVIPIVVGMLAMPPGRFALYNMLSAIIWAPFYIMPGYLTGKATSVVMPDSFYEIMISLIVCYALLSISFRFFSKKLQKGQEWYEKIESSKGSILNRLLLTFTNQQNHSEMPLASFTLALISMPAFIIWSYLVTNTSLLIPLDSFVNEFVILLREANNGVIGIIEGIAVSITMLGDEAFLYISFSIFVVYLARVKHFKAAAFIAASGLLTAFITHFLKNHWEIARPSTVLMSPESFAYPSGHTSGVTVLYGLLAAYIAQFMPNQDRWKCYLLFFIPMSLVAFSRVILNVHWLSDIIGGVCLGLIICSLSRVFYSRYQYDDIAKNKANKIEVIVAAGAWVIAAIVYQLAYFTQTLEQFGLANHL